MAGWAIPQERIAKVIGVDAKTLRDPEQVLHELSFQLGRSEFKLGREVLAQGQDRQALVATIFALKSRFGWVEATAGTS